MVDNERYNLNMISNLHTLKSRSDTVVKYPISALGCKPYK